MLPDDYNPIESNPLVHRLQSAENSINFIQREHASTLANLHEEIAKWQDKCSDLTFQLAIRGGTVIHTSDDSQLRSDIEHLIKELAQCKEMIEHLNETLKDKDRLLNEYENRLIVNERQHALDLRSVDDKHRQLKIELDQRSTHIAQLTNQLHREKQVQQQLQSRLRVSQIILPNKPSPLKGTTDEGKHQKQLTFNRRLSSSHRSNSEQELKAALQPIRRPPTPPQQLRPSSSRSIDLTDEPVFTKRQLQLLDGHQQNHDSTAVLRPQSSIRLNPLLPPLVSRKMPLKSFPMTAFPQQGEV